MKTEDAAPARHEQRETSQHVFLNGNVLVFVAVFVVSSVACGGGLFTHHRIGIEQATVFTCLDHGHGAERGRVRDCDAEVVSEQIVDVFFLARLQLVFRHTSPAREPRAAWVSREMCVGVILTPADEQDDQDDLGTAGVSNVIVFVHVCGVHVVRVRVCRCKPCRVCRQRFGELGGRCSGGARDRSHRCSFACEARGSGARPFCPC